MMISSSQNLKQCIFCKFFNSFFNICVLSQCIVYWIHFHNVHTFTYQKRLLHKCFGLFLKSSIALSVSLICFSNNYILNLVLLWSSLVMLLILVLCLFVLFLIRIAWYWYRLNQLHVVLARKHLTTKSSSNFG